MGMRSRILTMALGGLLALAGSAAAQLPSRYGAPQQPAPAQPASPQPVAPQPVAPQPIAPQPVAPAAFEPLYVAVNQQPTGPFGAEEIARKIAAGEITAQTLVYAPGLGQWTPAGQVPVLAPLLARQAQATPGGLPPIPNNQPLPQPNFAPPGTGSSAEEQRLENYLYGEWMREEPMPMAPQVTRRIQIRFLQGGDFYAITTLMMQGLPGTTQPSRGRWAVQPMQERRFVITTTGQDGAGSTQVEILDNNTMRDVTTGTPIRRIAR